MVPVVFFESCSSVSFWYPLEVCLSSSGCTCFAFGHRLFFFEFLLVVGVLWIWVGFVCDRFVFFGMVFSEFGDFLPVPNDFLRSPLGSPVGFLWLSFGVCLPLVGV